MIPLQIFIQIPKSKRQGPIEVRLNKYTLQNNIDKDNLPIQYHDKNIDRQFF